MKQARADWLHAHGPCEECGGADRLHVHHRDKSEKVSHRVWSWAKPRRDAELAKCGVLCGVCHTRHHAAERRKAHGIKAYRRGCRCETCTAAKRAQSARYRERHRELLREKARRYRLAA